MQAEPIPRGSCTRFSPRVGTPEEHDLVELVGTDEGLLQFTSGCLYPPGSRTCSEPLTRPPAETDDESNKVQDALTIEFAFFRFLPVYGSRYGPPS